MGAEAVRLSSPKAELVLYRANVITMEPGMPRAQAVAVRGGNIVGVGSEAEVEAFIGPGTRLFDCRGRALVPGFEDAHIHIFAFAASLLAVDCGPASVKSIADIQARLAARASESPPGTWIRAGGYNEFYLAERRHPTRWELDQVTPHHPVRLSHRSGHASVLNSLALSLVGISAQTPEPAGGMIDRDERGEPTGLLFDMEGYLGERVPPLGEEEMSHALRLANRQYLAWGITSLQDASATNDLGRWQAFARFKDEGVLTPRVTMMLGAHALAQIQGQGLRPGSGGEGLRLGAVKLAIGETSGWLHPSQEELNAVALAAHRAGWQLAFHAVEEGTVAAAANAIEHCLKEVPRAHHRHRVEHCSVCPPPLQERLRCLGALVVTQPSFIYYSGERYLAEVPPSQLRWLYPIRSFLERGLRLAAGSDAPVVAPNPLIGVYAAATRRASSGQALSPEEAVSPLEALAMYTRAAAYACFQEGVRGSIAVGKVADLALLSHDPTAVPPEQLKEMAVEMTMVGGVVVWERSVV